MVIDELIQQALAGADGLYVKDVRAGLGYTCVMLDDDSCGLAYTFRDRLGSCCGILGAAGSLIGKKASELIPWLSDQNLLKAAVGTAAVNAVFNSAQTDWDTGNVITALDLGASDTFGMVGELDRFWPRSERKQKTFMCLSKMCRKAAHFIQTRVLQSTCQSATLSLLRRRALLITLLMK